MRGAVAGELKDWAGCSGAHKAGLRHAVSTFSFAATADL